MAKHSRGIPSAILRPTPTELVVARLIAAGLTFRPPPTATWTLRHGQTSDRLLVHVDGSGRIETDLHAIVPGHPGGYGHYCECSLADPIRILADARSGFTPHAGSMGGATTPSSAYRLGS